MPKASRFGSREGEVHWIPATVPNFLNFGVFFFVLRCRVQGRQVMAKNESGPRPREGSRLWTCPSKTCPEETEMREQGGLCPSDRCRAGSGGAGAMTGSGHPQVGAHSCIYLWDGSPWGQCCFRTHRDEFFRSQILTTHPQPWVHPGDSALYVLIRIVCKYN